MIKLDNNPEQFKLSGKQKWTMFKFINFMTFAILAGMWILGLIFKSSFPQVSFDNSFVSILAINWIIIFTYYVFLPIAYKLGITPFQNDDKL